MVSYERNIASLLQRIASETARAEAAPPDPRHKATGRAAAVSSVTERIAAHRDRAAGPDPALAAARSKHEQTLSRQGQLKALRNQNRDLESQLHQALSIKSRKESECKRIAESISEATGTNEKLKKSLMELRNVRDTCAAVISDQFRDQTDEEKINEDATLREDLEAAVSWFSNFLGLQVIGGEEGVKFVFDKISPQSQENEYSFCIKIDDDRHTYNLVQCNPPIKDFEELVKDLNLSGDLLKFLKVAREKFQASSVNGSFSPPVTMKVNCTSENVPNQSNSQSKNKRLPAKRRGVAPSPGIARRSPRLS